MNVCFMTAAARAERKAEENGQEAPEGYFADELLDAIEAAGED